MMHVPRKNATNLFFIGSILKNSQDIVGIFQYKHPNSRHNQEGIWVGRKSMKQGLPITYQTYIGAGEILDEIAIYKSPIAFQDMFLNWGQWSHWIVEDLRMYPPTFSNNYTHHNKGYQMVMTVI